MGLTQRRHFCAHCEEYTLHAKNTFDFGMGCLLSLVCTPWILLWPVVMLSDSLKPFRCQACGLKYSGWAASRAKSRVAAQARAQAQARKHAIAPAPAPTPAASPAAPSAPRPPLIDWAAALAWIDAAIAGIGPATRAGWRSLVAAYRSLPEWAAPIVWGLGVASPIVTVMVLIRVLSR